MSHPLHIASTLPFSESPEEPVGLTGLLTIDSTPETALQALENMRAFYEGDVPHDTVQRALANVGEAEQGGDASILGHGKPGRINTGCGDTFPDTPDRFLGVGNSDIWRAEIKNSGLKGRLSRLTLCACNTGAGPEGALLVHLLADELDATVRAPTGLVWARHACCEPSLQVGSKWQIAEPGQPAPPPIDAPAPFLGAVPLVLLSIRDQHRFIPVPIDMVTAVLWRTRPAAETDKRVDVKRVGLDAREAAGFVRFDSPLFSETPPTTIVTGGLTLAFNSQGKEIVREFRIHNDSLLQDRQYPTVFYDIDLKSMMNLPTTKS